MILFFIVYALFGAILTITAYLARIYIDNDKLSFTDLAKALCICLFEITILRFIMSVVRMLSVLNYKKNKDAWDKIKRVSFILN